MQQAFFPRIACAACGGMTGRLKEMHSQLIRDNRLFCNLLWNLSPPKRTWGIKMQERIMLVEDDKAICDMVSGYLTSDGFQVTVFHDGPEAVRGFCHDRFDLALIDLMLPMFGGMDVIRTIRKTSTIPIIIVTARDNDTDKTMGLNAGADDYVTKPFSLIELTARIKANIRRATSYSIGSKEEIIHIRDLEINITRHAVLRGGEFLDLTHTEFEILRILSCNPGRAFSREQLYNLVWKEPYYGNENVLNTHMNRLRGKLKAGGCKTEYIRTLWGIGYKMEDV